MSPAPGDALDEELRATRSHQPLGPWWLGAAGLLVAAVLLLTSSLRHYGYALGATLGLLALLRAVLPSRRAGGLAVRGRWVDVATLLLLGAAVAVLSAYLRLG